MYFNIDNLILEEFFNHQPMKILPHIIFSFLFILLSYSGIGQQNYFYDIDSRDVFPQKLISSSKKQEQKNLISANFKIAGKAENKRLLIYLAAKNNASIVGRRGGYCILIPDELSAIESKICISFLDINFKVIETAYISDFEDLIYYAVKYIPSSNLISNQVEYFSKIIGLGELDWDEHQIEQLGREKFTEMGFKWDTQWYKGSPIHANYIRIEIPFDNSPQELVKAIDKTGIGMFFYFNSSVITNPVGVFGVFGGEVSHPNNNLIEATRYKIRIKGGGGRNTETTLRLDLGTKPISISAIGGTDATDGTRVGVSKSGTNFIDVRGNSWTQINNFDSRYLYVTLNSKWGTDKDSWIEIIVELPAPYNIDYTELDNNNDDLDYVRVESLTN